MSFFKNLETDMQRFGAMIENLFKHTASVDQIVDNFVNAAAPFVIAAVAIAAPEAEPEAAAALKIVETGLAAIGASTTAATSGATLLAKIKNFNATIPALLSGIEVKNPELKTKVEALSTFVTSETAVLIPIVQASVSQAA